MEVWIPIFKVASVYLLCRLATGVFARPARALRFPPTHGVGLGGNPALLFARRVAGTWHGATREQGLGFRT